MRRPPVLLDHRTPSSGLQQSPIKADPTDFGTSLIGDQEYSSIESEDVDGKPMRRSRLKLRPPHRRGPDARRGWRGTLAA